MHLQTDRALIPAATPSVRYLQLLVSAPPAPAPTSASRSPVDVALVLDRSGFTDGSKITMARTAVTHAVRLLKPADHVAVVCYDDQVDTVLERTPASHEAKALVFTRLAGVDVRCRLSDRDQVKEKRATSRHPEDPWHHRDDRAVCVEADLPFTAVAERRIWQASEADVERPGRKGLDFEREAILLAVEQNRRHRVAGVYLVQEQRHCEARPRLVHSTQEGQKSCSTQQGQRLS